jgi:hypothetical protein
MEFLKSPLRLFTLAALAVPAAAQPVITREIPPTVHWPAGEWFTVTVEARGSGSLIYQWYKGPAELMKRSDKSPCRLAGQDSDTLAMECAAHMGGDYWVEVTDTADHRMVLEGPMRLVPCFRLDAKGKPASLLAGGGSRLIPVAEHQEKERQKELDRQAATAPAVSLARMAVHPGSGLPTGRVTAATAQAPAAARTESKGWAASAAVQSLFPHLFDDMPELIDAPEGWGPQ